MTTTMSRTNRMISNEKCDEDDGYAATNGSGLPLPHGGQATRGGNKCAA